MATAYARRSFAGGAISTTIPTGMGSSDSTFTLAASTNWTFANNFYVVVDRGLSTEEKILCSSISGLVVTVSARGADGTSGVSHAAGCTVQVCHVAQDDDEANQVVSAVLGQSGAAKGDLFYMNSVGPPNVLNRLPIGSTEQVLEVVGGVPAWVTLPSTQTTSGEVDTAQGTTSTSFTDLGTVGPTVTITTGVRALVTFNAIVSTSGSLDAFVGFAVSGATTIAAGGNGQYALLQTLGATGDGVSVSCTVLLTTLTSGSNVFTMKYRVNTGTGTFSNRTLIVQPLG